MASMSDNFLALLHAQAVVSKIRLEDVSALNNGHIFKIASTLALTLTLAWAITAVMRTKQDRDGIFTANRLFPWEPTILSRIRWSMWAQDILQAADQKAQGQPYRLARGDTDLLVLPARLIPDLNKLGTDILDSRQSHAFTLIGHLTGMKVVRETSYHVRMLLARITPALPELFSPMATRISAAVQRDFPAVGEGWKVMQPLPATVRCFSEGIALVLYGKELSADPHLVRLTYEHTRNVFTVAFAMRCVPSVLQPFLVWLMPAKWRLNAGWRALQGYVVPEVQRQKQAALDSKDGESSGKATSPDLITWMVKDGRTDLERDPLVLTTLTGSVAAGATYSIANFVCRALSDLAACPADLAAVRDEIRAKHAAIDGQWTMAALNGPGLDKLESALKETARLAPGTLIVYSRVVQRDHVLPDGTQLRKGQFITVSGPGRAMDPAVHGDDADQYRALRFCDESRVQEHRSRPFNSVDTDILAWGAGRWACPGRMIADMAAKILMVKLLDEFDFAFVDGVPVKPSAIHEFLFFHPDNKMLLRRREDAVGIVF